MGISIGLLLTIVVTGVVAWPFLFARRMPRTRADGVGDGGRGEAQDEAASPSRAPAGLRRARGEIYAQIRLLELDRAAGLVEDADFREQLDDLRAAAATLMMREAGMTDPEAALEREIAEARLAIRKDT